MAETDPVVAGGTATWTIAVRNAGPSTATNVSVVEDFPLQVTNPSGTGDCTALLCTIPVMEPNDVATLTVTGTVDPAAQDQSQLTNTVTATPTETDPVPSDNTAQATVTVERLAGTEVTKLDNPDPAIAGQHVTYTLEVVNRGPSVADNTVLIDALPAGLTFASGSDECRLKARW